MNDGTRPPAPVATNALRACWCHECLDAPEHGINNPTLSTFIVCPACGNKRCPRATDHRFACTGSNEVGQFGSRYGTSVPAAPSIASIAAAAVRMKAGYMAAVGYADGPVSQVRNVAYWLESDAGLECIVSACEKAGVT